MSQLRATKKLAPALAAAVIAAGLLPGAAPLSSDDRDIFRESGSNPYVMILFDSTGSMQADTNGNLPVLRDDDPTSRLFQAKQALDAVLRNVSGVNFGFATFPDQDRHRVFSKSFRNPPGDSFVNDSTGGGNAVYCAGIEPNDDTSQDIVESYTYKFPTTIDPRSGLEVGDLVPLNWADNNVDLIRTRLAPNLVNDGLTATADFSIEDYFQDSRWPGTFHHRLVDESERPFIARGTTPLGGALSSFQNWYEGWLPLAEAADELLRLECRQVFVILMTDGFETCGTNGVTAAGDLLRDHNIPTYVIGFAVNNPALDDIALAGGTDSDPDDDTIAHYNARNQQQLVDQLNAILADIKNVARSFATAAVPSVVGAAANNIYLSSFSPLDDTEALWPGRVDGWVQPLPVTDYTVDGKTTKVPDRRKRCSGLDDEGCLAWDAGEEILDQAPNQSQVDAGNYMVGNNVNERRIYFGRTPVDEEVPLKRTFFLPPTDLEVAEDLYGPAGFGIGDQTHWDDPTTFPTEVQQYRDQGQLVIETNLVEKVELVEKTPPETGTELRNYVLADVFHSDPRVLTEPNRFLYFGRDTAGEIEPCPDDTDMTKYPCFVQRHQLRRKVLFFGSNEGALHAVDAGTPYLDTDDNQIKFTPGTGKEMFAFVPRTVMQRIRGMARIGNVAGSGQEYTVDGPVVLDDVLIDPQHAAGAGDPPAPIELDADGKPNATGGVGWEWRTVAIAGLREGGIGYYALDVTQPDPVLLATPSDPNPNRMPLITSYVPGCLNGGTNCGPVDYPQILWEFNEKWGNADAEYWDEDNNGKRDLADTWSKPNTGRIRVTMGGKDVEKYVAIFGGGMDAEYKRRPFDGAGNRQPHSGNFLYMVDIETGKVIYKRRLDVVRFSPPSADVALDAPVSGVPTYASVPSEPAAIDSDFDSYIDTIYVGTTGGYMYKVDISQPMELKTVEVRDYSRPDPGTGTVPYKENVQRVVAPEWEPFAIFNANCSFLVDACERPIYYPPTVVFVNELGRYALAFGTGDREDIRRRNTEEGRFYVMMDAGITAGTSGLPFPEALLTPVDPNNASQAEPVVKYLLFDDGDGLRGWFMPLKRDERLLSRATALSGILAFTTFTPDLTAGSQAGVCATTGEGRLYVARITSATPLDSEEDTTIVTTVDDLPTQPFVSSGKVLGPDDNPEDEVCGAEQMRALREELKSEFPSDCTFSNYSLEMQVMLSETGLQCVVPVPVCVIERNWKEF